MRQQENVSYKVYFYTCCASGHRVRKQHDYVRLQTTIRSIVQWPKLVGWITVKQSEDHWPSKNLATPNFKRQPAHFRKEEENARDYKASTRWIASGNSHCFKQRTLQDDAKRRVIASVRTIKQVHVTAEVATSFSDKSVTSASVHARIDDRNLPSKCVQLLWR